MSDIKELEKRLLKLEKEREEKDLKKLLKSKIKELEEENTFKGKAKKKILAVRDHLREKGKQFQDNGQKLQKESTGNIFGDTPIARMSREVGYGWGNKLSEELNNKEKIKKK